MLRTSNRCVARQIYLLNVCVPRMLAYGAHAVRKLQFAHQVRAHKCVVERVRASTMMSITQ